MRIRNNLLRFGFLCCIIAAVVSSPTIATTTPIYQVIFKADDLREPSENVIKLDEIVQRENIKISWGIIGKSLRFPSKKYLDFLKEKQSDNHYYFFNHGFWHVCDHKNKYGSEFTTLIPSQIESLRMTQNLVKEKCGITLGAFGAPCNHINENTKAALDNFKEIEYWFFGIPSKNKKNIERIANIENPVGKPNAELLRKNFERLQRTEAYAKRNKLLVTLQIHPYMWDESDFLQFEACIAYLKSLGVEFVVPSDLQQEF